MVWCAWELKLDGRCRLNHKAMAAEIIHLPQRLMVSMGRGGGSPVLTLFYFKDLNSNPSILFTKSAF